jgi:hypothetical protein
MVPTAAPADVNPDDMAKLLTVLTPKALISASLTLTAYYLSASED